MNNDKFYFVLQGTILKNNLNHPMKTKVTDDGKSILLESPEIVNYGDASDADKEIIKNWFDEHKTVDENGVVSIWVNSNSKFPYADVYDLKNEQPFEVEVGNDDLPKDVINTQAQIEVFSSINTTFNQRYFTVQAIAVPDTSNLEYYVNKSVGHFGK